MPSRTAPTDVAWPWTLAVALLVSFWFFGGSLKAGPVAEDFESLGYGWKDVVAEATRPFDLPGLRPGTTLFFALLEPLFGRTIVGYRAVAVMLHGFAGFAVFVLARRCLRSQAAAGFAAVLFLGAPVHPEAVVWLASAAGTVTSSCLVLAACLVWTRSPGGPTPMEQRLAATFYLLALLCKETALPLPLLLIALDSALGRRAHPAPATGLSRRRLLVAPVYFSLACALLLFVGALVSSGAWHSLVEYADRDGLDLRGHLVIWSAYAHDLLRPLAPDKTWSITPPFRASNAIAWWAIAAVGFIATLAGRRGRWAVGWALAALAPGFGKYGERLTYLAVAGAAFVAAVLALRGLELLERLIPKRGASTLRRRSRLWFGCLTVILLFSDRAVLSREIAHWVAAGEYAARIPREVRELLPAVPARSKLYFRGLVDNFEGAYSLRMGIHAEMRRIYADPTLTSFIVADRRPHGRRVLLAQIPCNDSAPRFFFEWDAGADRLLRLDARQFGLRCATHAEAVANASATEGRRRMIDREPRRLLNLFHDPPFSLSSAAHSSAWSRATQYPRAGEITLARRAAVDADEVGGFALVSRRRLAQPPVLRWRAPATCPATLEVAADSGRHDPDGTTTYFVVPLFEPCWRSRVADLELAVNGAEPGDESTLAVIDISRVELKRYFDEVAGAALRIDVGGEVRSGFLTSGGSRKWSIVVPTDGELHFAYAAVASRGGLLRISRRVAGEPPATLLEAPFGAIDPSAPRWLERRLSLAAWSGRQIEIEFASSSGSSASAQPAPAFVADVEIEGNPAAVQPEPPSIVLISVDTLRADRLSLYGNPRKTSPRIDAWASRHAVVFETAIAQAPWTLPSHVSMLTGLNPMSHGVNEERPAGEQIETLAELLRARGYRTLAVTGGAWMSPRFGLDQGFDVFAYSPSQQLRDLELARGIERALELVGEAPRGPLLLFFHTYHVHAPHRARAPYFSRFSELDPRLRVADPPVGPDAETGRLPTVAPQLLRGEGAGFEPLPDGLAQLSYDLYDSAVAEMDDGVGRLLATLRTRFGNKPVLFVVTSDHGESLGEHGVGGHNNLYDEVLRVPLIVEFPDGTGSGTRVASQVRSIDLVPTLLSAAGLRSTSPLDGRALQEALTAGVRGVDRPARSYTATGPWSLALRAPRRAKLWLSLAPWGPARGETRLFDLGDDPQESHNLALAEPAERQRLERAALAELRDRASGLFLTAAAPADAPLRFTIDLAGGARRAIKLLGPPPKAPILTGGERLELSLAAAERVELWFEQFAERSVRLQALSPADGDPLAESVVAASPARRVLQLVGRSWRESAAPPEQEPTLPIVELIWRFPPSISERPPIDEELAEQLRALGYLR